MSELPILSNPRSRSRTRKVVLVIMVVGLLLGVLFTAATYAISWPSAAPLAQLSKYTVERDRGFAALLQDAQMPDDDRLVLKVHFGWSQNVWIALRDLDHDGARVAMLEGDVDNDNPRWRAFATSQHERDALLTEFDRTALGPRLSRR